MSGLWNTIATNFDNREIAIGIWLIGLLVWGIFQRSVRQSLFEVVKAFLDWKLLLLFGSFAIYTATIVLVLEKVELWKPDQIVATILWYLLSGTVMLGRSLKAEETPNYFRAMFVDNFRVVVVFEFVIVAQTFSLLAELIFVPFMAILGALLAFSELNGEYGAVKKILERLLALMVLALVWYSASTIWSEPENFFTFRTGRNFFLPILLTVLSLPIFYFWFCLAQVERENIALRFKKFQSDELKSYARRRFFVLFGFRPTLLRRAVRQFQNLPAKTNSDVDKIIDEINRYQRLAKKPPKVDESKGWSPFVARDFMAAQGLRTDDYHRITGEFEWWAISPTVELDKQTLPNTVIFSIEGNEDLVKILNLRGNFIDKFDPADAVSQFNAFVQELVEVALPEGTDEIANAIQKEPPFDLMIGNSRAAYRLTRYPNESGFNLHFSLKRS